MTSPADGGAAPPSTEAAAEAFALLTAGELVAFSRIADDAAHAPHLEARVTLSTIAAATIGPRAGLADYVRSVGVVPGPFGERVWFFCDELARVEPRTAPRDWWERLIRTYIGYGVFADLEHEVVRGLSGVAGELGRAALTSDGLTNACVSWLRPAIEADPSLGARLALWGRRVVGEALGVCSRLLHSQPELARLCGIPVGTPEAPAALAATLGRLTAKHAARMRQLDLTA